MIHFFIIASCFGQTALHIQAKAPITHLHDQTTVTSFSQGKPMKPNSLDEQKLGTISIKKKTFGTFILKGPVTGAAPLPKTKTETPPVPDLTTRTIPLQEQPMRTTPLQEQATGMTPLQENKTSLPESTSIKTSVRRDGRQTIDTSSAKAQILLSSTSSIMFVPTLTEKNKGIEKNEEFQTPHSQNNSIDDSNRIAKIFAYLLGSSLIIMVVTTIVIWKCVAKRAPVDTNWAGRSPLADGEFSPDIPLPTEEAIQCVERPSITSNNLLPTMFTKKQFLLDDDSVQANSSKDNLQDGENEVGQSNPTLDILNSSATMPPNINGPEEFKNIPKLTELANSEQQSVVSTKLVNEPPLPEPPKIPILESASARSFNYAYEDTELLDNHLDSCARDEKTQKEPQLFPLPPPCIINEDRLEEFPPPSPEVD